MYRAKVKLRNSDFTLKVISENETKKRLDAVLKAIYLLFNEGYHSLSDEKIIRKDLCLEAMRLCLLLHEKKVFKDDKVSALMGLMCYHSARFNARIANNGSIVTMENQERKLWNQELIAKGDYFMSLIPVTSQVSVYHLEAGISAYYCHAKNYEKINWKTILAFYDQLQILNPSPMVKLNRAVVLCMVKNPKTAIKELQKLKNLEGHHHYQSILATFYAKCEDINLAKKHFEIAYKLAPTHLEKKLIRKKLNELV